LNEAYNALKHPLTRAKHLLALSGVTVLDEANSAKPDTTLLMEIMELQERLENGRTPQLQAEIATRAKACEGVLADAFKNNALEAAKTSTIRLSYYYKLLH
jgi:molecular chaperone HscB